MSNKLTNVELLSRTLALLSEPTRWTQGAIARDASDAECNYDSPNAVRWCIHGALCKMNGGPLTRSISWHNAFSPMDVWNDRSSTSHQDVVTALEAALDIAARNWDRLQKMGLLTARQRRLAEMSVGVAE